MYLLIQPIQFFKSIHSMMLLTLDNPIILFKTISKVCYFFSISSHNLINRNNQSKSSYCEVIHLKQPFSSFHFKSITFSMLSDYHIHLIQKTLILKSLVKFSQASTLIDIYNAFIFINHSLLPNTYFE